MKAGILGATGMVGQKYIELLKNHPWFEIVYVAASPRSAGKTLKDAIGDRLLIDLPEDVANLSVNSIEDIESARECDFLFSAMPSSIAKEWEEKYAKYLPVISSASTHRWTEDIPMLIPEINPDHIDIISHQQKNRDWKGFIVVKPNCSIQSYMMPLFALREFGIKEVIVTTMQAVSGAGHVGLNMDIQENVIPFIGGEEEKSEEEPKKIFGTIKDNKFIKDESFKISAHCNRVPVIDGHMACVSVKFDKKPTKEQILERWKNFKGVPQELNLPMAPEQPIIYTEEENRPQPKLDRDNDKAMAVTVGRLREGKVFDWKFVGLSHNLVRGAAGGGIINAELLKERGYLG